MHPFQLKPLSAACAAACALFATSSQAAVLDTSGYTKVMLAGATAPDNFLKDLAPDMLAYTDEITASNYRAFRGTVKAGVPGVAAGTKLLFIKRSKGGSVFGVDPVARAQRIETFDFNNCTQTGGSGTTADPAKWTCGLKGSDPGTANYADAGNAGEVPDFGVSDVEPKMFQQPLNTENNAPQLTSAELGNFASFKPVNQLMMGIVTTAAVPETLHIGRSQYGQMLSNRIQDWTQIDDTLAGNTQVVVCRRVPGSGTQTSYNWFFNNFPCSQGIAVPPAVVTDSFGYGSGSGTEADPIVIDPTQGYTVVENSSSGDVRNCLANAQDHKDHKVKGAFDKWYLVQFSNSTEPFRAIGVLSLDSYSNSVLTGGKAYFRPLDGWGKFDAAAQSCASAGGCSGALPSKANLAQGRYDFVVELSMQYRGRSVTNVHGDVVAALAGTKKSFVDEFIKRAGKPEFLRSPTNSVPNAYAALPEQPSLGVGFDPSLYAANEVSYYSREGNTCKPLRRFF